MSSLLSWKGFREGELCVITRATLYSIFLRAISPVNLKHRSKDSDMQLSRLKMLNSEASDRDLFQDIAHCSFTLFTADCAYWEAYMWLLGSDRHRGLYAAKRKV